MKHVYLIFIYLIGIYAQHDLNTVDNRSVIVHLFEWKFSDIAEECEKWLGPKGFGAVQISSVSEHISLPGHSWLERFQPISYKINTRSGNEEDLLNMTKRCNANGVRIYADVVLNHMTAEYPFPIVGTGDSTADPTKYDYPGVPYKRSHFHRSCEIRNWNEANQLRNCELNGLRDLNQTRKYVRDKMVNYLNHLVDVGVAGFHIVDAKHMSPDDLEVILDRVNDLNTDFGFEPESRPFIINELYDSGSEPGNIGRWEYMHFGMITEFLVPGELGRMFRGKIALKWFKNWGPQWNFLPSLISVIFLTDHALPRGYGVDPKDIITHTEPKLYVMATAYLFAHPYAVTRFISSYEFQDGAEGPPQNNSGEIISPVIGADGLCKNGWTCEHRWPAIVNMIGFRNDVNKSPFTNWWDNDNKQIAFSRGEIGFIVWNIDEADLNIFMQTCLPAGTYCDVISGQKTDEKCTGKIVKVDDDGLAKIYLSQYDDNSVLAIHRESKLDNNYKKTDFKKMIYFYAQTNCYRYSRVWVKHAVDIE